MAWIETLSPSFTARHDSADSHGAREVLDRLEVFRALLDGLFEGTPGEVTVVIHSQYLHLAVAQPWVPIVHFLAAPAGRRYLGGWFAQGEIHVLAPDLLRSRASEVAGSREALELVPLHEYAHLVVGANNGELPPPFTARGVRRYLRWAWLHEGAATWLSGQDRHLAPAIARRLREGGRPGLPPGTRDAWLLGGAVLGMLEARRGREACLNLIRAPLEARSGLAALEDAFGTPPGALARDWRDWLDDLGLRGRR